MPTPGASSGRTARSPTAVPGPATERTNPPGIEDFRPCRSRPSHCSNVGPVSYWFRLRAHPDGPLPHHEFAVDGDLVYPRGIGRGCQRAPWFQIDGGFVFATEDHPDGPAASPWYEIVRSEERR